MLQELDDERATLRHQQKELRRQHTQLKSDKEAKQVHLAGLNAKCRDVQLLKFGQVIDVALLDTIGVRNKGADELREALKQQVSIHNAGQQDRPVADVPCLYIVERDISSGR